MGANDEAEKGGAFGAKAYKESQVWVKNKAASGKLWQKTE